MSRTTNYLIAFGIGMAAGAVLGVLYAPDEGKVTREKIATRLREYSNQLRELIGDLLEQEKQQGIAGLSNSAKTEGQRVISDAREQAEKLLGDVDALMGKIKGGSKVA